MMDRYDMTTDADTDTDTDADTDKHAPLPSLPSSLTLLLTQPLKMQKKREKKSCTYVLFLVEVIICTVVVYLCITDCQIFIEVRSQIQSHAIQSFLPPSLLLRSFPSPIKKVQNLLLSPLFSLPPPPPRSLAAMDR